MDKQKIILINQSSGYLTVDIANALADSYSEVVLLCGILKTMDTELSEKIKLGRLIPYNRNSKISRFSTWIWSTLQILWKLLFVYKDYEVLYVSNPPMAYFVSLFIHRPFSVLVFDIYPDALKNIGIAEKNPIYSIWAICNKKIFSSAKYIFTLSEGMKNSLARYVKPEKICIVPNWSYLQNIPKISKDNNPFVKQLGLNNKFVVLYSGNIGYTHNVEVIIHVANLLSQEKDILFLIIGDGAKKPKLQQMVKEYNLDNCLFFDWQPEENVLYSLASADLSIVTVNDVTAMLSVPSKTYNLMAVGSPLLCIANLNSELNKLVSLYNCGSCFDGQNLTEIANYIMCMKKDEKIRDLMSRNSFEASSHFTKHNALRYVEYIKG